jgi:hypothetical protein
LIARRVSFLIVGTAVIASEGLMGRAVSQQESAYAHPRVYSQVLSHAMNEYVEQPNMSRVSQGAFRGFFGVTRREFHKRRGCNCTPESGGSCLIVGILPQRS